MSSHKIVIGNWKMNPASAEEAKLIGQKTRAIASRLQRTEVVACPPFPFISICAPRAASGVAGANFALGAQTVSIEESGPHTGEVGADMLKSLGVSYVVVGHSESRTAGESDATVSRKIMRVLENGMTAVVCVGEKARDESGSHFEFLKDQLKNSLAGIPAEKIRHIILAYEPVWAIGAKEAMVPADVYEMSLFVKKTFADLFGAEAGLKVKVLYGGSVNFRNAADIITIGKVDGLLVGRESVNMPGFSELVKAVDMV